MKLRSLIVFLLLAGLCPAVFASAPVGVKEYVALRRKYLVSVPLTTLNQDASTYIGRVCEIRGRLAGLLKSDAGPSCSMIICTEDASYTINADFNVQNNPGDYLACLAKIGEGSAHSLSDLRLVAYTYDADLRRVEEDAARSAQAKAARSRPARAVSRQKTTSRAPASAGSAVVTIDQLVRVYGRAIRNFNPKLSFAQADTIARSIIAFSLHYKVDARLVCAVILAESHFRLNATSGCGAQGLGQLMPSTAAGLGVNDAYDPVQNIYGSVRYIKSMLDRTSGNKQWSDLTWSDLALALAAYNAGPGAVKRHGGVPPYRETQNYVRRVTSIYRKLCGVGG